MPIKIYVNNDLPNDYQTQTNRIIQRIKLGNLRAGSEIRKNLYVKRYGNLRYIIQKEINEMCENHYILGLLWHEGLRENNYDNFNNQIRNNQPELDAWIQGKRNNCNLIYQEQGNNCSIDDIDNSFLNSDINILNKIFSSSYEIYESSSVRKITGEPAGVVFTNLQNMLQRGDAEFYFNINGINSRIKIKRYQIYRNMKEYFRLCIGEENEINRLDQNLNRLDDPDNKLNFLISFVLGDDQQGAAYPDWYLYDMDLWKEARNNPGISISPEEEAIIEDIIRFNRIESPFPIFIRGRAGSGKTLILNYTMAYFIVRTYLLNKNTTHLFPLYVTKSDKLKEKAIENVSAIIKKIEEGWRDNLRDLKNWFENNKDKFFKTYTELLSSILNHNINLNGFDKFKSFYNRTYAQNRQFADISPWLAWYVLNAYILGYKIEDADVMDSEDYQELPKERRNVSKEVFRIIHGIYQNLLINQDQFNIRNTLQYKVSETLLKLTEHPQQFNLFRFGAIICDEAQDFTRNDFELFFRLSYFSDKNLNGISKRKIPLIFAADEFQTVNPTNFSWEEIRSFFYELLGGNLHNYDSTLRYLSNNYRSARNIVEIANNILSRRLQYTKENNISEQNPMINTDGNINLFNIPTNNLRNYSTDIGNIIFVVPNETEKVALRGILSNIIIYTPEEIKGLEFSRIAVLNFFNNCPNLDRANSLEVKYFFSKLYVAVTRAKSSLFIIDNVKVDTLNNFGININYNYQINFNDNYNSLLSYIENINTMIRNEELENANRQIDLAIDFIRNNNINNFNIILSYFKKLINQDINMTKDDFIGYSQAFNDLNVGNNFPQSLLNNIEDSNRMLLEKFFLKCLNIPETQRIKDLILDAREILNPNVVTNRTRIILDSFNVFRLQNAYPNNILTESIKKLATDFPDSVIIKNIVLECINKFAAYGNFLLNHCFNGFLDFISSLNPDFLEINNVDNLIMRKIKKEISYSNIKSFETIKTKLEKIYEKYGNKMNSYGVILYYTSKDYKDLIRIYKNSQKELREYLNLNLIINLFKNINFEDIKLEDMEELINFIKENWNSFEDKDNVFEDLISKILKSRAYSYKNYQIISEIQFNHKIKEMIKVSYFKFLSEETVVNKAIQEISDMKNLAIVSFILENIAKFDFLDNSASFKTLKKFVEDNILLIKDKLNLFAFCSLIENIFSSDYQSLQKIYMNKNVFDSQKMNNEDWRFTRIRLHKIMAKIGSPDVDILRKKFNITEKEIKKSDEKIKNASFNVSQISIIELKKESVEYNKDLNIGIVYRRDNKLYILYNNLPAVFDIKEGDYIHEDTKESFKIRKDNNGFVVEFFKIPVKYLIKKENKEENNIETSKLIKDLRNMTSHASNKIEDIVFARHKEDKIWQVVNEIQNDKFYFLNIDFTGNVLHKPNCPYVKEIKNNKLRKVYLKDLNKYKYKKCKKCFNENNEKTK